MSFETVASTVVVLAILVGLIAFLAFLKKKGKSFTFRVFTAGNVKFLSQIES